MKRLIIITAIMAFTTSAFAQSQYIEYRKILDNGEKISIKTKAANIKEKGQHEIGISIMYETAMKENPAMSGHSLFITFLTDREDWQVPFGGKLLIRTSSGQVISLKQTTQDGITLYDSETGYENKTYLRSAYDHFDRFKNRNIYLIFGKYPIGNAELRSIIEEGVIKIRLETTGDNIECEYPVTEYIRVNAKEVTNNNIVSYTLSPYYKSLIENIDPKTTF